MDFNPDGNFVVSQKENILNKISEKKAEIVKELSTFCEESDNSLDFVDYGLEKDSELIKNTKIKEGEVFEDLSDLEKEEVIEGVESFKSFLKGPIFTDSFHENQKERNNWEDENEIKIIESMGGDVFNYFKTNRLRVNSCQSVLNFLDILSEDIKNSEIKDKLVLLRKEIPLEFTSKELADNEYIIHSIEKDKDAVIYHVLNDKGKIEVVKKLTKIVKKALSLLTEKSK